MKKYKNVAFMAWRPYLENTKYYREWISTVLGEIDCLTDIEDINYISTDDLLGKVKNYNLEFYIGEIINNKHIINLDFSNFKFFLEHVLPNFDIIITSHHHYPFILLLNKYAKKYNIKTILVQHGIRTNIDETEKFPVFKRLNAFISFKKEYFLNVIGLLKQIVYAMLIDPKVSHLTIKNLFLKRNALVYPLFLKKEYKFSQIYVYSQEEYSKYLNIYDKKDIKMMGDPDIQLYLNYISSLKPIWKQTKPYVLYIDQGLIGTNNYISHKEFNKFVNLLIKNEYDFYFLERPKINEETDKKYLHYHIKYLPPRSINKYIDNAEYTISHWSTLLNLPMYLHKKIIILVNTKINLFLKENNLYEKFSQREKNIFLDVSSLEEIKDIYENKKSN